MLLNFSHWFFKNNMSAPDLTEARISSKNLGLLGIIDAVFEQPDKVVLVDYKTSKHAKITDDTLRQAALYCLLYHSRYKKIPEAVWIHFLMELIEEKLKLLRPFLSPKKWGYLRVQYVFEKDFKKKKEIENLIDFLISQHVAGLKIDHILLPPPETGKLAGDYPVGKGNI